MILIDTKSGAYPTSKSINIFYLQDIKSDINKR